MICVPLNSVYFFMSSLFLEVDRSDLCEVLKLFMRSSSSLMSFALRFRFSFSANSFFLPTNREKCS